MKAADEFLFGFDQIKRWMVEFCGSRDQENKERDETGDDDVPVGQKAVEALTGLHQHHFMHRQRAAD